MAKNLKLNIKNTQIAQAFDLKGLKNKLAKPKTETASAPDDAAAKEDVITQQPASSILKEEPAAESPRIKARSKSAFAEPQVPVSKAKAHADEASDQSSETTTEASPKTRRLESPRQKTSEELRKEIFKEELAENTASSASRQEILKAEITPELVIKAEDFSERHVEPLPSPQQPKFAPMPPLPTSIPKAPSEPEGLKQEMAQEPQTQPRANTPPPPRRKHESEGPKPYPKKSYDSRRMSPQLKAPDFMRKQTPEALPIPEGRPQYEKLGPTGKHVNDLLVKRTPPKSPEEARHRPSPHEAREPREARPSDQKKPEGLEEGKLKVKSPDETRPKDKEAGGDAVRKEIKGQGPKAKEFRDVRPTRKTDTQQRTFDARDRQGLRSGDDEPKNWRKKRLKTQQQHHEELTVRPTTLKVRIPIMIKDLAAEMKLKASQLISKLFMQGIAVTLNDLLDDETTIQLLGQEFGCEITIDTAEEERLRVTDKKIKEEIAETDTEALLFRPPVVAFMGHVDHGKTSLIDYIRKSNRAAGEAGAITQHIGAFRCHTAVGDLAILDTPGHEAFSSMRARGADVTDIVVLVVAGDEGMQQQTVEALQHAKAAGVSIIVAINKCDKPNFNPETVYRQLSENNLLPEAWGGQTITVNCSAVTGEGISTLLEMLALQAEVLELKANPLSRARGSVLESEMHKGMGAVATVLVQNGTLKLGDALVFGQTWGRVKTMHNELGKDLKEAGPSTPVEITGLSGLPDAGEEFIAVKNEREAREIAEGRMQGIRQTSLMKKKISMENLFQQASDGSSKKMLNVVLRADVQGSLEALKVALLKITSSKAEINIIFTGVGEISESDVQLAAASKAIILGFHTQVESHADTLVKEYGVQVRLHDIIYHAIDDVKSLLAGLLDKIAVETEKGKTLVKATFKSSQYGIIAGCQVIEGSIHRNHQVRLRRGKEVIWKGSISSLKRVKEDVREVTKGLECGIVLNGFSAYEENDILESFEITYIVQEL